MIKQVIDLQTKETLHDFPCGLMGFIGFERLEKILRDVEELNPMEKLTHVSIDADGFHFRTTSK
jgi:hypothetical protein